MYRIVVLHEKEPDAASYAEHAEVCKQVPNGVFRHGKIVGSPGGEPAHAYYAEWEFADEDSFKSATRSDEFMASGKDARERGYPQPSVFFADIS
jgi:hypothetical protein